MALKEGAKAPDFNIPNENGEAVSLNDFKGKNLVLFFFPKADTPGWTIEACGFRDAFNKIQKTGTVVVGVSADTPAKQKKFKEKYNLPYTLLADTDKKMCRDYDVIKEKTFMGRKYKGIARTSFLIDPAGKVTKIFEDVKPKDHAEEVLAAIKG